MMLLCKCSYCWWWALLLVGIQLSVGLNVVSSGAVSHECDGRNIQIRVQGSFIVNKRWILTLLDTDGGRHFFTDSYASRCGFTMSSDHRGTLILDATLLSCNVYDQNDSFNLDTEWVFENISWTLVPETVVYRATCREHYDWASREILCAQNYMEVSVDQTSPRIPDYARSEADWLDDITMFIPSDQIWRLVFTVAGQRQGVMTVEEAVRIGYSINSSISDTRVVFRSPYFTNHTYAVTLENGLVIQMIKPLVYFRRFGLTLLLDMVIACPLSRPQPLERWLSWSIPLQPPVLQEWSLLMVPDVQLVMGRHLLDDKAMAQRGVILSRNSSYMMLKVPWGVAGGINQSCVEHGQQGLLYSVDLQLLVTWQRLSTKLILFTKGSSPCQMTTQQFLHGPVGVHCKQDMFQLIVGPYKEDIYLTNVTIGNTAFIVCGFYADGEVSFATSPALCERAGPVGYKMYMVSAEPASYYLYLEVLYSVCPVIGSSTNDVHSYQLPVALLFMDPTMMKPISFFSTMVCDVHEPSYMGTCTEEGLKLVISSSLLGPHWLLFEGGTWLGPSNLRRLGYTLHRNGTHLSLVVPHGAEGLLYEETDPSHVRYSFTLLLKDNVTLETKTNFTVTCRAPAAQISCFPNGTVAFTAPRVDIKPPVDMSKLALHDSSCGPQKVGPNGAYFEFGVDTCGTLRKLHDDFLVYENELSVPRETLSFGHTFITRDNVYRLKVTCSYRLNDTLSLIASARSGQRAHFAFAPVLPIQMVFRQAEQHEMDLTFRMAKDEHFSEYYVPSEYPVVKFLQDPLFFEVRLLGLNYKNIELFLDNCWATERPNRDSIPQWPVITKSCPNALDSHRTIFHHVIGPESSNAKRFEVKTFIFGGPDRDESQLFFHCSIILCDTSNIDMLCKLDCIPQKQRAVRSTREGLLHGSVSSGGVLLLPSPDSPLATPANKMSKTKEVWKELVVVGLAGLALAALISTMIYLFKSATAAVVLT